MSSAQELEKRIVDLTRKAEGIRAAGRERDRDEMAAELQKISDEINTLTDQLEAASSADSSRSAVTQESEGSQVASSSSSKPSSERPNREPSPKRGRSPSRSPSPNIPKQQPKPALTAKAVSKDSDKPKAVRARSTSESSQQRSSRKARTKSPSSSSESDSESSSESDLSRSPPRRREQQLPKAPSPPRGASTGSREKYRQDQRGSSSRSQGSSRSPPRTREPPKTPPRQRRRSRSPPRSRDADLGQRPASIRDAPIAARPPPTADPRAPWSTMPIPNPWGGFESLMPRYPDQFRFHSSFVSAPPRPRCEEDGPQAAELTWLLFREGRIFDLDARRTHKILKKFEPPCGLPGFIEASSSSPDADTAEQRLAKEIGDLILQTVAAYNEVQRWTEAAAPSGAPIEESSRAVGYGLKQTLTHCLNVLKRAEFGAEVTQMASSGQGLSILSAPRLTEAASTVLAKKHFRQAKEVSRSDNSSKKHARSKPRGSRGSGKSKKEKSGGGKSKPFNKDSKKE